MEQTPKEKAKELFSKMYNNVNDNVIIQRNDIELWKNTFKQCALIAVEEILNGSRLFYIEDYDYWQEVKQELIKSE